MSMMGVDGIIIIGRLMQEEGGERRMGWEDSFVR